MIKSSRKALPSTKWANEYSICIYGITVVSFIYFDIYWMNGVNVAKDRQTMGKVFRWFKRFRPLFLLCRANKAIAAATLSAHVFFTNFEIVLLSNAVMILPVDRTIKTYTLRIATNNVVQNCSGSVRTQVFISFNTVFNVSSSSFIHLDRDAHIHRQYIHFKVKDSKKERRKTKQKDLFSQDVYYLSLPSIVLAVIWLCVLNFFHFVPRLNSIKINLTKKNNQSVQISSENKPADELNEPRVIEGKTISSNWQTVFDGIVFIVHIVVVAFYICVYR